ncbi:vitamin K-dependent gamma-carboxylase-like protein [Knoellia remsis]|uniref:Vitamin K-dependent gamma-carboxylase-like protein n=1 Tax=Knoellia remsis TaxID=407159 RepID=A0A2T0U3J5_9MICO|nr:HTTM domain-containing protein [Knoellia remsis]PRY52489.1 vitamin K-dependent gamma-carboxylase-like protein [Knoellia remsis]
MTALTSRIEPLRIAAATAVGWLVDRPRALSAVAVIRAVIGLCGLAMYVSDYRIRHLLFRPDVLGAGVIASPQETGLVPTLYSTFRDGAGFEAVYHVGMLAALAVTLGVGGRLGLAVHYLLIWSLYATNPLVLDGGDNLVMILGLVLLLTRCYDRLTVVRLFRGRGTQRSVPPVATIAHNTGVLLVAAQICIVYLMAGLYKVQGRLWQDGTALYYVLRVPEFTWPGVTEHLFRFEWLLVLGAYATVWLSIYFPLLVLVRRTRLWAVLAMSVFHVSIAALMGLTSFALIMIACDLVFVNSHVERAGRRLSQWGYHLVELLPPQLRQGRAEPVPVGVPAAPSTVTRSRA